MLNDERDTDGDKDPEVPKSEALIVAEKIHSLLGVMENKLYSALKPPYPQKEEVDTTEVKSDLMKELEYLQNKVKDIVERLHI